MNSKNGKGGEKVKKKVILFSSVVVLMLFAVAPLMASSAKACIIVPVSVTPTGPPAITVTGFTATSWGFIVKFDFEVSDNLVIGTGANSQTYQVINIDTAIGIFESKSDVFSTYYDGSSHVVGNPTSGFRNNYCSFVVIEYGYNPTTQSCSYVTAYVIGAGFGIFAGHTLVVKYAGTNLNEPWSGYLI